MNEEEEYLRQQEEAAAIAGGRPGRSSVKRARHSPHPSMKIPAPAMNLVQYAVDPEEDDLIIVGATHQQPSRTARTSQIPNASLKRSHPVASPLRPGAASTAS